MSGEKLNKNNIYNSIATFINFLYPLITFPYVTRVLGVENIGKFNFSNSVVAYFNLIATLGISTYAIRECAKNKIDRKKFSDLASEIFSIDVYSTLVAYILLFSALFVSKKLKDYNIYILLLSTSFALNTIGTLWVCNAVEDFKYISLRTIILHMFTLAGLFVFVKNENHLYIYVVLTVIANFGSNLFNVFYRKRYVDIRFVLKPNIKKHLKKIILLFSQTVSMLLFTNADVIMLGYCYNDQMVGLYAIAVRIYNTVNSVIASVIVVATPGLSYDYSVRNFEAFNEKISYVVNYIMFLFIPAFIGLNLMAPEIIYLISGHPYELSIISLRILTFSLMFSLIAATLGLAILFPMGCDKVNFISCIISAVSNILLNLYFIPKFGVIGAAFTTAFAEFVGIINKIKFIDRNISIANFWKLFFKYLIGSVFIIVVCMASKIFILNMIVRAVVAIPIGATVYFSYLYIIKDPLFINLLKPIKLKLIKILH